jgi:hypothetical protein
MGAQIPCVGHYALTNRTAPLLLLGGFAAQMLKCVLRFWTPRYRANPPH